MRRYEAAHIDLVLFIAQSGDRKHEDILPSLELFAKEVLPEFQERHEKHRQWRAQQLEGVPYPINSTI